MSLRSFWTPPLKSAPIATLFVLGLPNLGLPKSSQAQEAGRLARSVNAAPATITASRAVAPPKMDGLPDDAVWESAELRSDFRTFTPKEDAAPTFATVVQVGYDDRALYVFVRAFDPRPDSVVRLLSRRDTNGPPNDQIHLFIDSFNDRRSGYEYIVNAAGVKSDYLMFDDSGFDQSWDGVWGVATRIDSLGWSAEFAIPLQQLRFRNREAPTFGIMIWRLVGRTGERVSWPLFQPSRTGYMSQTGTLAGMQALSRSTSVQAVPYLLGRTRNVPAISSGSGTVHSNVSVGADARFRPKPNLSLDATFNPDFGQVESDPAVLDLSGFEVFQAERRPFFLQESGQFTLPLAADGSALLFNSRRIGRAPALAAGANNAPTETSILGAAMLSARASPTTSVVALSALTARELANTSLNGTRPVVEPQAHYGATRLQHDFRRGRSGLGLMITRVDRAAGDSAVTSVLPTVAQAAAVVTQHQSMSGNFRLNAWVSASDIRGSTAAMSLLQQSNVHGFQRPDDGIAFDSTRNTLRGAAGYAFLGKVAGGITRYDISYRVISPGYDVNEMGFLTKAGLKSASAHVGLRASRPGVAFGIPYNTATASLGFAGDWSTAGLPLARGVTAGATMQLRNLAQLQGTLLQELPGAYCEMSCTRGDAALVDEPRTAVAADVFGNPRRRLIPHASFSWNRDDGGRSRGASGSVDATWRAQTNLDVSVAAYASGTTYDAFFYRRFGSALSDTAHATFAHLTQPVRSLTTRLNYTLTPALSVQWYAQAYLSRGTYSNLRELNDARADRYDDRFRAYRDSTASTQLQGIDFRQFRSNAVLRWEYGVGSTLFVVWTQGRNVNLPNGGDLRVGPDLGHLFDVRPDNVVAVKFSRYIDFMR